MTWKQTLLDDATELWGIRVARVEIKDVRIPVQLQRSMAAEAEATREARAKVRGPQACRLTPPRLLSTCITLTTEGAEGHTQRHRALRKPVLTPASKATLL